MITITLQAPKKLWLILASFADSQWAQCIGRTLIPGKTYAAVREMSIMANQWKLVHDDIMRNIGKGQ